MDEATVFETMATALQERGIVTADQVAADRAAMATPDGGSSAVLGVAPPQKPVVNVAPAEPDNLDATTWQGPASPAAYNFGQVPEGFEHDLQQDADMRALFHGEAVPVSIGNEVGRLYAVAMQNPPTPAQLAVSEQQMLADLHKAWGADMKANLALACREIDRMALTQPRIKEMLDNSGLGNSAWLAQSLVNMAKAKGRR